MFKFTKDDKLQVCTTSSGNHHGILYKAKFISGKDVSRRYLILNLICSLKQISTITFLWCLGGKLEYPIRGRNGLYPDCIVEFGGYLERPVFHPIYPELITSLSNRSISLNQQWIENDKDSVLMYQGMVLDSPGLSKCLAIEWNHFVVRNNSFDDYYYGTRTYLLEDRTYNTCFVESNSERVEIPFCVDAKSPNILYLNHSMRVKLKVSQSELIYLMYYIDNQSFFGEFLIVSSRFPLLVLNHTEIQSQVKNRFDYGVQITLLDSQGRKLQIKVDTITDNIDSVKFIHLPRWIRSILSIQTNHIYVRLSYMKSFSALQLQ